MTEEEIRNFNVKEALYIFIWQLNTSIDLGEKTDIEETICGCEDDVIAYLKGAVQDTAILDELCRFPEYIVKLFANIDETSINDVRRKYTVVNNGLCFLLLKASDMLYHGYDAYLANK